MVESYTSQYELRGIKRDNKTSSPSSRFDGNLRGTAEASSSRSRLASTVYKPSDSSTNTSRSSSASSTSFPVTRGLLTGIVNTMGKKLMPRFAPTSSHLLIICLILLGVIDSGLIGYDSTLMGALNVMPTYKSYFTLTTATLSLNTAISYVGGALTSCFTGLIMDWRGRRQVIFLACIVALVGGVIQGSAQGIGQFIAGRFIVGCGMALAQAATPTLVAETVPKHRRGLALGLYSASFGIGTLSSAGVCYGTQHIPSTWAWRIPSLCQVVPSLIGLTILLFVPESPRWLISRGRKDEAMEVLTIMNNYDDHATKKQFVEISETLALEKQRNLTLPQALTHKSNRHRLFIATSFSAITMLAGTNVSVFYFGTMLKNAGITDPTTQLQINIILTSWKLIISGTASLFADRFRRKWLCAGGLSGQIVALFLLGAFTKLYGHSNNKSGIYATIAMIFIDNGIYCWGIYPLTVLYPPEVLSFEIRAVGMSLYTLTTKLFALLVTMAVPFGLKAIGYQFYFVNASFDVLLVILVVLVWVETKGLSLEEVDRLFDKGKRHAVQEQVRASVDGSDSSRTGSSRHMGKEDFEYPTIVSVSAKA